MRSKASDFDLDVRDFYYNYFPSQAGYRLALVTDFCVFYEMTRNNLGNVVISQISINENPLIISAFAVAALIAVFGSVLFVNIIGILYKTILGKYSKWVNQQ